MILSGAATVRLGPTTKSTTIQPCHLATSSYLDKMEKRTKYEIRVLNQILSGKKIPVMQKILVYSVEDTSNVFDPEVAAVPDAAKIPLNKSTTVWLE